MRELIQRVNIEAPPEAVWKTLADFGGVADWAPYMKASRLLGEQSSGVGTRRWMRHAWGFRFEEDVTAWEEGKGYSFDVLRAPFPMTEVRESWVAEHLNGTSTVTTRVTYNMKLGWFGSLLDTLLVQFIVTREMKAGLKGLKQHIEA